MEKRASIQTQFTRAPAEDQKSSELVQKRSSPGPLLRCPTEAGGHTRWQRYHASGAQWHQRPTLWMTVRSTHTADSPTPQGSRDGTDNFSAHTNSKRTISSTSSPCSKSLTRSKICSRLAPERRPTNRKRYAALSKSSDLQANRLTVSVPNCQTVSFPALHFSFLAALSKRNDSELAD